MIWRPFDNVLLAEVRKRSLNRESAVIAKPHSFLWVLRPIPCARRFAVFRQALVTELKVEKHKTFLLGHNVYEICCDSHYKNFNFCSPAICCSITEIVHKSSLNLVSSLPPLASSTWGFISMILSAILDSFSKLSSLSAKTCFSDSDIFYIHRVCRIRLHSSEAIFRLHYCKDPIQSIISGSPCSHIP